ncbi:hypothetical protein D9M71_592380 [compost metagenome]
MHQYGRAAIGFADGSHIHVTHAQGLALGLEVELVHRVRILEPLQFRAVSRLTRLGRCNGHGRQQPRQNQAGEFCKMHG